LDEIFKIAAFNKKLLFYASLIIELTSIETGFVKSFESCLNQKNRFW
jgi:hypothetical protein